jgi:hypothetical protein
MQLLVIANLVIWGLGNLWFLGGTRRPVRC